MMNQNNNLDDIDKMLFSYFDNNKDIPSSTQDTILKTFEKPRKTISLVYKIQKVAIVLISFIILTTGVVFAKDIINFITSLFTNTTEGINKAIENGYVQNIDMDFVYDNDIGIKVDYLVMDDTNLDVSFVYDYKGKEKIESISIYEYIIRDEENNLIYYTFENIEKMNSSKIYTIDYTRTHNYSSNKNLRESILYQSKNFPKSQKLTFEIHSIIINNSKIKGNWLYDINLNNNLLNTSSNTYLTSYSQYIDSADIHLEETALNIKLLLNTKFDENLILHPDTVALKDCFNNSYKCLFINTNTLKEDNHTFSELLLNFDISQYHKNTNLLYLEIKLNNSEKINIVLSKRNN